MTSSFLEFDFPQKPNGLISLFLVFCSQGAFVEIYCLRQEAPLLGAQELSWQTR